MVATLGSDQPLGGITTRDAAPLLVSHCGLSALSTAQNFEEITDELGVRQLSVQNSDTEFHDNTPNTLAADTRSVTDGSDVQRRRSNFLLRQEIFNMSEESNHN